MYRKRDSLIHMQRMSTFYFIFPALTVKIDNAQCFSHKPKTKN